MLSLYRPALGTAVRPALGAWLQDRAGVTLGHAARLWPARGSTSREVVGRVLERRASRRARWRQRATSLADRAQGAFRFRFRDASGETGIGIGNGPRVADSAERARVDEAREDVAEPLVADAEASAQLGACERSGGECGEDGLLETVARGGRLGGGLMVARGDDIESDVVVAGEGECERFGRGRSTVLDGQEELSAVAPHVEERVRPGKEVARATEALAGLSGVAVLARVMDDEDGDVVRAL